MVRYILILSLLILVTIYALRRGGMPERTAALILVSIQVSDTLYHAISGAPGLYREVDPVHAAIDLAALAAMVWLALRRGRVWTLWLAGLQVIAALSHFARATETYMIPIVYATFIEGPFWGQVAVVGLGTWLHVQRQRREAQMAEGHALPEPDTDRHP